jgi:hypothetical protein
MKFIVHIGMPKCGSSSIQTFLSSQYFCDLSALNNYAYVVITSKGEVLSGDILIKAAQQNKFKYETSASIDIIRSFSVQKKHEINKKLRKISKKFHNIIISNEGWAFMPSKFNEIRDIFNGSESVNIFGYVRPQVKWLNSAWWQWGAWTNHNLGAWINHNIAHIKWFELKLAWQQVNWINNVLFYPVPLDLHSDFLLRIGLNVAQFTYKEPKCVNKTFSECLLRVLQHNPDLKLTPHDSSIDFVLERYLGISESSPWVIPEKNIQNLLAYFKTDNINFINSISESEAKFIVDDKSWWDVEAYKAIKVVKARNGKPSSEDMMSLCANLIRVINDLDSENSRLKHNYLIKN